MKRERLQVQGKRRRASVAKWEPRRLRGKKKSKAEKRSEWVGDREPDRVFSDGATLKHVKSPTIQSVRRDVGTGQSKEKRAATPTCWAGCANYCWNIRVSACPPTASFSPLSCRLLQRTKHANNSFAQNKKKNCTVHKIKCDHLHVRVDFRDSALCNLLLVAHEDLS